MKSVLLIGILSLSAVANAQTMYAFNCTTDTGKQVTLSISFDGRRNNLDRLVVDGADYSRGAWFSVTRGSGIQVVIDNYRDRAALNMTFQGPNGDTYKLGSGGATRTMSCSNLSPSQRPYDGI